MAVPYSSITVWKKVIFLATLKIQVKNIDKIGPSFFFQEMGALLFLSLLSKFQSLLFTII